MYTLDQIFFPDLQSKFLFVYVSITQINFGEENLDVGIFFSRYNKIFVHSLRYRFKQSTKRQ